VAEAVVVYAPHLAPLAGEKAFDIVQLPTEVLQLHLRLDEAILTSPGASLFRRTTSVGANPTTQGISLRPIAPSGASRALVTLDGAPVNDPFGGWVIWTSLPPESLDGVTLVRGAGAGAYGSGALTGTVELREQPATGGLQAMDVSGGQENTWRGAAVFGAPGLMVSVSGERSDGYTPVRGPQQGPADTPLNLQDASFAFRVQHSIGEAEASARFGVYDEKRGAGLAGAASNASGATATFTIAKPAEKDSLGWRLQAWMRASDLSNSSVSVAPGRVSTTPANDEYSTPAQGYGVNAALQGRGGALGWEAGVDARLARGEEFERFRYQVNQFTRLREAGGHTSVVGVYLDADWTSSPWLVTGGVRVDAWSNSDALRRESDLNTGAITLNAHPQGASGVLPTARAGVRYDLSQTTWLRAAGYMGFRAPTLNELHRPFRVGNDVTESNPALKPEKLQGLELGLGGDPAFAHWSTTVYYNRLVDPITNVTIGIGPGNFPIAGFIPAGGTLRQRQNAGLIKAWGLEGDANGQAIPNVTWRAGFAYTHARVDGESAAPQLTGKLPAEAPALAVTAGLDWTPVERLLLSTDLRYESLRYEDDLNTRRLEPGMMLDARVAWRIGGDRQVYVAVANLINNDLAVGQTADGVTSYGEPRTVLVGFSLRR
jgi:outer membrane receptor protein involved in Fe transport